MSRARASAKGLGSQIFAEDTDDAHPVETFTDSGASNGSVVNIPIDRITPNPEQPRKYFDAKALEELSESIRTRGLLQPFVGLKASTRRTAKLAAQS